MPASRPTPRLGSLCTGYGGLDLAVGALLPDVQHAWHAETDEAAAKVLAAHWPDTPNLGDITTVDWIQVEPVDVLTGGVPCQPFSGTGKRGGSADERHLWPTGMLPAITALRPALVVFENVPGLLTIEGGRVFATVLADLDRLGYHIAWTTTGACRVGACHHRHRVFLVATLADVDPPDGALFGAPLASVRKWPPAGMVTGGLVWDLPADVCGATDGATLPTPTACTYGSNQSPSPGAAVRPSLEGIVQMLPTPTARLGDERRGTPSAELAEQRMDSGRRNLEDAVALLPTPRVSAMRTGRSAILGSSSAPSLEQALELARGEMPRELQSWNEAPASWQPLSTPQRFGTYEAAVRRQEAAFGLPAPDPTEPGRLGKPRLSPAFPEWMVGLPAGWITDHAGRSDSIRIAGNGVVWQAAARALTSLPTFQPAIAAFRTREEVAA